MATFANDSFDVSTYASFRPSYSDPHLLDVVTRFHQNAGGELGTAVDLGCGTGQYSELFPYRPCWSDLIRSGQVTRFLSWTFKKVIGVDPSVKMAEEAEAESYLWEHPSKVRFIVSSAEDVTSKIPLQSADLVTAGKALITPTLCTGRLSYILQLFPSTGSTKLESGPNSQDSSNPVEQLRFGYMKHLSPPLPLLTTTAYRDTAHST